MKIACVMGSRPEFVQAEPVINNSKKHDVILAHVEAGLRSFDMRMPEEINLVAVYHVSNMLFAPTNTAVINLSKEGISEFVYNTGDVMDSLLQNTDSIKNNRDILDGYHLQAQNYFMKSGRQFIFPIHPLTEKDIEKYSLSPLLNRADNILVIKPLGYLNFLRILQGAKKVMTDSGGIQKQAFMLGIPGITLRENTEWVETVKIRWNVLVGTDKEKIKKMINIFSPQGERPRVYGNGKASNKIAEILTSFAGKKRGGQTQG